MSASKGASTVHNHEDEDRMDVDARQGNTLSKRSASYVLQVNIDEDAGSSESLLEDALTAEDLTQLAKDVRRLTAEELKEVALLFEAEDPVYVDEDGTLKGYWEKVPQAVLRQVRQYLRDRNIEARRHLPPARRWEAHQGIYMPKNARKPPQLDGVDEFEGKKTMHQQLTPQHSTTRIRRTGQRLTRDQVHPGAMMEEDECEDVDVVGSQDLADDSSDDFVRELAEDVQQESEEHGRRDRHVRSFAKRRRTSHSDRSYNKRQKIETIARLQRVYGLRQHRGAVSANSARNSHRKTSTSSSAASSASNMATTPNAVQTNGRALASGASSRTAKTCKKTVQLYDRRYTVGPDLDNENTQCSLNSTSLTTFAHCFRHVSLNNMSRNMMFIEPPVVLVQPSDHIYFLK